MNFALRACRWPRARTHSEKRFRRVIFVGQRNDVTDSAGADGMLQISACRRLLGVAGGAVRHRHDTVRGLRGYDGAVARRSPCLIATPARAACSNR